MTMVARVADGLPLTASIQEDEQVCIFDLSKKSCQIVVLNQINVKINMNSS